jgi:predicted ATP-dependent endonuclease of OLD family
MLSSIHIQGFKGFKDTKIEPLRRVNLIVGGQNSGKTSLLEAVYASPSHWIPSALNCSDEEVEKQYLNEKNFYDNYLTFESNAEGATRAYQFDERLAHSNLRQTPFIRAEKWFKTVGIKKLLVTALPNSPEDAKLSIVSSKVSDDEIVSLYEALTRNEKEEELITLLRIVDSRLHSIRVLSPEGEDKYLKILHANLGLGRMVPFSILGEGFNRLVYIFASLITTDAKIVVIDELENGIHYSALPTVWQGIANIARELDIQLFITTHSYECIQAATKVFEATPEDFQIIRLERTEDNNIDAILINDEKLKTVLSSNWEIR